MGADRRPLAIAVMGPTASGKTATAIALARQLGGEIVSVDSALVYRGLDIGSAKPDAAERAQAPHHLLDLRDPWQTYSAAEFAVDAARVVADIIARGRMPILAGGTGLYFRALLQGLSPMPPADPATRAVIGAEAAELGWSALHAQLAGIDPAAAARIHATDPQRIQRALEVYRLTGTPISEWQKLPGVDRLPVRCLKLVLAPRERSVLPLRALPGMAAVAAPLDLPAVRAVGYRQAWEFLDGQGSARDFRDKAIQATRQLAKRQLTWLRGELDARWFDPHIDGDSLADAVAAFVAR
jgi:tRNA dimethylallyltransferase